MKPYGNTRRQNLTCQYGCCTSGTVRTRCRGVQPEMRRRSRKAARQAAKNLTKEDL
jgi:hypothetical protein